MFAMVVAFDSQVHTPLKLTYYMALISPLRIEIMEQKGELCSTSDFYCPIQLRD